MNRESHMGKRSGISLERGPLRMRAAQGARKPPKGPKSKSTLLTLRPLWDVYGIAAGEYVFSDDDLWLLHTDTTDTHSDKSILAAERFGWTRFPAGVRKRTLLHVQATTGAVTTVITVTMSR